MKNFKILFLIGIILIVISTASYYIASGLMCREGDYCNEPQALINSLIILSYISSGIIGSYIVTNLIFSQSIYPGEEIYFIILLIISVLYTYGVSFFLYKLYKKLSKK